MTDLVDDPERLRGWLDALRRDGRRVGFVPTMGALHEGHLSLVHAAVLDCDVVVTSIFVNPLQFGPGEDLDTYPRDLEGDAARLGPLGVDMVFAPDAATFTPPTARTTVTVSGLTEPFEGALRPGHFDGVTTIVTKLCNVVGPCRAYFGEKDYQQLVVVSQLVRDLHMPVRIVSCPIVRDADGLALSSRNAYLTPDQRRAALAMPGGLQAAAAAWDGDVAAARATVIGRIESAPGLSIDYVEVVDPATLEVCEGVVDTPARLLAAVRVGATRLLDNVRLERD